MSQSFFERNKKKGALALLLLLLRRGKGVMALLVLVTILAGVFVLPGGLRFSWPGRLADRLGLRPGLGGAGGAGRFADMEAALRAARDSDGASGGWAKLWSARAGLWRNDGRSTIELVRGAVPQGGGSLGGRVGSARSVAGIAHPDETDKRDKGVELSMDEFMSGLVRSADAGTMAGGGPGSGGGEGSAAPAMAAALSRGSAVSPGQGVMSMALAATKVPPSGGDVRTGPKTPGGRLDKLGKYDVDAKVRNAYQRAMKTGARTAFYSLAEARAYSVTAAPPSCEDPGCPKEYAATTSGIVFEAGRAGSGIITSPELNEPSTPSVPNQGAVQGMIDEAEKYNEDARKCEEAESNYGPRERELMKRMDAEATELKNAGCDSGGCSREKYNRCKAIGNRMRGTCTELNQVFRDKANACPLSNGRFDQHDCNQ